MRALRKTTRQHIHNSYTNVKRMLRRINYLLISSSTLAFFRGGGDMTILNESRGLIGPRFPMCFLATARITGLVSGNTTGGVTEWTSACVTTFPTMVGIFLMMRAGVTMTGVMTVVTGVLGLAFSFLGVCLAGCGDLPVVEGLPRRPWWLPAIRTISNGSL